MYQTRPKLGGRIYTPTEPSAFGNTKPKVGGFAISIRAGVPSDSIIPLDRYVTFVEGSGIK